MSIFRCTYHLVFDHGQGAHTNFLKATCSKQRIKHSILLAFAFRSLRSKTDYPRLVHNPLGSGEQGKYLTSNVYAPEYMHRMNDLLFKEQGVFHPDLDGRMNSSGSRVVYKNRGGTLPRKRPSPNITSLYDGQIIESDHWKVTVRQVYHQPGIY